MKKAFNILLALLVLLTLTSCGSDTSSTSKEKIKTSKTQQTERKSTQPKVNDGNVTSSSNTLMIDQSSDDSNLSSETKDQSVGVGIETLDKLIPGGVDKTNSTLLDNSGDASNELIMTVPSSTPDLNELAKSVGQYAYESAYQTLSSAKNFSINVYASDNNATPVYSLTAKRSGYEDPTITSESYPLIGE